MTRELIPLLISFSLLNRYKKLKIVILLDGESIYMAENEIKLFNDKQIRTKWDEEIGDYYFSVIDVIAVLTESSNPSRYWSELKKKICEEQGQPFENIERLKLPAKDGKMRLTDVANTKQLLRIIQSVPSPKAEPFKQWLAQVGSERLDEIVDPELGMERLKSTYRKKGYSEKWISQRMRSIEIRDDLTAEWDRVGVEEGLEYAILTNEISKASFGLTTRQHKSYKGLKKESLRDNMTNAELVINMLGELATTEISKTENPGGFEESKHVAKRGGNIAGNARKELEANTGRKVLSKANAKDKNLLEN